MPNTAPDRNCDENEDKRKRPVGRQEAAEQLVNKKREQQDEREIAQITLAEENVLDRTEISEARAAIVENAFTTLEEACEIAVHQLLQDGAADAVIEKPVIPAVERPNAAEKARIVNRDDKGRKSNSGQRQDGPLPLNAHQRYDKTCKTGESESADQKLPRPDGPRRIDPHGECVWNDCDAEYAPAGVGRFDRPATFTRPAREALVFAFPHHGAAPAQRAANVTGRNPDHLEPRHREIPAMPAHPEPAVARRARYIVAACPVVSPVIDEAEP